MNSILEPVKTWLINHGIPIVVIIIGVVLAKNILQSIGQKVEKKFLLQKDTLSEKEKRLKTLSGIIHRTVSVFIYTVALLMIISECGIAIGPLLAGAGIAGVVIGFGAQSLVKDIISGFFLIMENQIRVGDVVNVAGIGGLVEAINLRTTRLRDLEGKVHIIPNGCIEVATNFTKDWSRALIEIGVAYKENVDRVIEVLTEVGEELRSDAVFSQSILEPMTVLGVDSFGDSSVNIKVFFKTVPLKQWDVAREFRKRVKKAFDNTGIEIPFPHRTIYIGEDETTARLKIDASVCNHSKKSAT